MAYIHKKTFDIVKGSNIDSFLGDGFLIDDLIALSIQTLNWKGYTTTFWCSGHPFPEIGEINVKLDNETANCIIPGMLSISEQEKDGHCVRFKQYLSRSSNISFDMNVPLPEHLPDGWHWDDHTMYVDYCRDDNAYIFLDDLLYTMRELNKWVEALPLT